MESNADDLNRARRILGAFGIQVSGPESSSGNLYRVSGRLAIFVPNQPEHISKIREFIDDTGIPFVPRIKSSRPSGSATIYIVPAVAVKVISDGILDNGELSKKYYSHSREYPSVYLRIPGKDEDNSMVHYIGYFSRYDTGGADYFMYASNIIKISDWFVKHFEMSSDETDGLIGQGILMEQFVPSFLDWSSSQ